MEKLEKLEKVKILRDGHEVDAYLNIAEDAHAWIEGPSFDDITLTIFGEFLDENKNPIDYEQIVTEYEGMRDLMTIPKRLNKKRVNDKEIEEYQDKKYEELQRNLPLMYRELDKMIAKYQEKEKEKSLWLLSTLKVNDIIDEALKFCFYEDNGLHVMYIKGDFDKQEKFLIKVETINDEKFETVEEVLDKYPYAGHTTKETSERFKPEWRRHGIPESMKHPWKTKWKKVWENIWRGKNL